nr:MAG TPA: hypothetical protein [Crassvirales sp.]DAK96664.1 MAG TPA: hypothetical protein [Bacteriophage sp.]DAO31249.1 MAG TPA: hypothetical protein [Crassvirales sp.]
MNRLSCKTIKVINLIVNYISKCLISLLSSSLLLICNVLFLFFL